MFLMKNQTLKIILREKINTTHFLMNKAEIANISNQKGGHYKLCHLHGSGR